MNTLSSISGPNDLQFNGFFEPRRLSEITKAENLLFRRVWYNRHSKIDQGAPCRSWHERDAVEFSVVLGPYEGTVRVPRRVFQGLLRPTPERCVEAFHLQRTRFEMVAERKLRRRQLTEDGNVEITRRDLRERTPRIGQGSLFGTEGARVI